MTFDDCDICHYSKQHRLPFPQSNFQSTKLFELIHLDVWGPYKQVTHSNYYYLLTAIDDFSKATWVFLFSYKSRVSSLIQQFILYIHNQFKTSVQTVRLDNGTDFTNSDLQDFFKSKGILHQTSCPATPQKNGQAERKHQHLLNVATALIFQYNLPQSFWGDFILRATQVINMFPIHTGLKQ